MVLNTATQGYQLRAYDRECGGGKEKLTLCMLGIRRTNVMCVYLFGFRFREEFVPEVVTSGVEVRTS